MTRSSPLLWLALLFLLLLPTAAGRVLVDIAGGLMLVAVLIPLLITGFGWIGWKILQSKMVTCEVCGVRTFQNNGNCSFCGSAFSNEANTSGSSNSFQNNTGPASDATIDVQAEDISSEVDKG